MSEQFQCPDCGKLVYPAEATHDSCPVTNWTKITDWTKVKLNPYQKVLTAKELKWLPALYSQEGKKLEAICYVHFFYGNYDFWATEFDPETGEFFGIAQFAGNEPSFGYANAQEWIATSRIERELNWTPKPLGERHGFQ